MKNTHLAYPNALYQRNLLLFIFYFIISSLCAQRTISGKVFFADGTEQIGGYVSIDRSLVNNTVVPGLGGDYVMEVPDSTKSLYFYYDGTINPTVPVDKKEVVNVINHFRYFDFRVNYPKIQATRSVPTMVSGVVMEKGKPKSGVEIIPMENKNKELPGVKTDDGGQFYLEVPPEATALKVGYEWQVQHFVIPNVKSIYIPVEMNEKLLPKRLAKRLKRQWKRQNKKTENQ